MNNQPHILKVNNVHYELNPQYFICLEQCIFAECKNLWKALFIFIAVHYVFNVSYHSHLRMFFLFVEEKLFHFRGTVAKTAAYNSTITGIQSYLK